jgi:membrane protein implicated in regulation of membrane protease activity
VNFRGTLWQYESNDSNAQFSVGEKVRVFPAKGNVVTIGKL